MTYRLVALDIDGTVVDNTNSISPAVAEAVAAARAAGLTVVLSTGRGVPGTVEVAQRLGIADGLGVSSNGATVFTYDPFEVVHAVTFDAAPVVRRIVEELPDVMVGVEEVGVGFRVSHPFPEGEISGRITVEPIEDLIAEPSTRVVIRSPEHTAAEFAEVVDGLGLQGTNYFIGYTAWLDLAPEGVSKASGLEQVCTRLGIDPAEVLAVGDGHNDVEMLRWAGRGVAMGQAPAEVREAADDVTGTVEEDGLATELRRWL
ncbi:MAG: HAD family hydrolase [Aeromicrobium erythreum]